METIEEERKRAMSARSGVASKVLTPRVKSPREVGGRISLMFL